MIGQAYAAEQVDEMFAGSWPRVQVALGLKEKSDFTPEELKPKMPPEYEAFSARIDALFNAQKPSAMELRLPIVREELRPEKLMSFREIVGKKAAKVSDPKSGFGSASKTGSKKRKKKR